MKSQIQFLMLLPLVSLMTVACGKASFNPARPGVEEIETPSELLSKIEVTENNVADGITPADVVVIVMSQTGVAISGAEVNLTVSGFDNVIIPCTKTNELGHARCKVFSTRSERKKITVSGRVRLATETWFSAPNPMRSTFAVVSSASVDSLPSGHQMITTSGIPETPVAQMDNTGAVRAHTSILGSILNDQ